MGIVGKKGGQTVFHKISGNYASGLDAAVGTAETSIAHGLGVTPSVVMITVAGTTAEIFRSSATDATNINLTASAASSVDWIAIK